MSYLLSSSLWKITETSLGLFIGFLLFMCMIKRVEKIITAYVLFK